MNGTSPLVATVEKPAGRPRDVGQISTNPTPVAALVTISNLLIDPENVLYDATLWPRWLRQVLARMGRAASFPEFFSEWDQRFRKEVDLGQRDYWDAFREFLAEMGFSRGQTAELLAASVSRKQRFERDRRCLPGVRETLCRLGADGVSLYLLSNTPRPFEVVRRELEGMGLARVFRGGLTSLELGCVMPASRCFRLALERFELEPAQTALLTSRTGYLGPAERCGILGLAFNEDRPASVRLDRFHDLTAWIRPKPQAKAG